jgi:hypothetical protein
MMAISLKSIVDGLKRRDDRRRVPSRTPKSDGRIVGSSDYDAGVKVARESVQVLEKELRKKK